MCGRLIGSGGGVSGQEGLSAGWVAGRGRSKMKPWRLAEDRIPGATAYRWQRFGQIGRRDSSSHSLQECFSGEMKGWSLILNSKIGPAIDPGGKILVGRVKGGIER